VDLSNVAASDAQSKTYRRRLSSEDSALVVRCIPDEFCNILQLKKHFAKYGVTRVFVNTRNHSATVNFRTHVNTASLLLHLLVYCENVKCYSNYYYYLLLSVELL